MINRYIVTRKLDSKTEINSFMAAINLNQELIIMGAGFDPFDPFANYKVDVDYLDYDNYFSYGGRISDIIIDAMDIIELYQSRFNKQYKQEDVI